MATQKNATTPRDPNPKLLTEIELAAKIAELERERATPPDALWQQHATRIERGVEIGASTPAAWTTVFEPEWMFNDEFKPYGPIDWSVRDVLSALERLRIPGGWLYRLTTNAVLAPSLAIIECPTPLVSVVFVPDHAPEHTR